MKKTRALRLNLTHGNRQDAKMLEQLTDTQVLLLSMLLLGIGYAVVTSIGRDREHKRSQGTQAPTLGSRTPLMRRPRYWFAPDRCIYPRAA